MATISMLYELPVTITSRSIPCLNHAVLTDRCSSPDIGYVALKLCEALTPDVLTGESLEHYSYLCGSPNFYESLQQAKKFGEARVAVQEIYSIKCDLSFEEDIEESMFWEPLPLVTLLTLHTSIEGQKAEGALRDFISRVGEPYFVAKGSDYKIADRILAERGLKTKRKVAGLLAGKHVVPSFI